MKQWNNWITLIEHEEISVYKQNKFVILSTTKYHKLHSVFESYSSSKVYKMLLDLIAVSVGIAVAIKCCQLIVKKGRDLKGDEEKLYKRHRQFVIFKKKLFKDN